MYNDLFSIGPIHIHTYGVMTAIGILAAYFLMTHLTKKRGLDPERVFGLLIFCLIFGYLGSKLLYIITQIPTFVKDPSLILKSFADGWVIYGGLLGGIFGGWLYCRWRKLPPRPYYDVGLTSVALAQGFGRLGCFFAGCCYGVETDSAFCTVFHHSEYAPNNVRLVPTQLLSSAGDFLLFFFLLIYDKKWKKKNGTTAAWYLILYSLGRFTIEFWRGDTARGAVGPLSTSQFIGLFTALAGVILMVYCHKKEEPVIAGQEDAADGEDTAEEKTEEKTEEQAAESTEEDAKEDGEAGDGEKDGENGQGAGQDDGGDPAEQ